MDIWDRLYSKAKQVQHGSYDPAFPKSGQIQIMLDYPERKIVTLKELFPLWWGQLN